MDNILPEILHIVCSFLSIDDIINFRLVSKTFADIGAAYMLPEVTFYLHEEELKRLRDISLHPIFSRHVFSLTYFAQALDSPKVSFREFVRDYKQEMKWNKTKKVFSPTQLLAEYKKYEEAADKQDVIMRTQADITLLKEVMPRFPNLEQVTMSSDLMFYEGIYRTRRSKPFDKIQRGNNRYSLDPEGVRPLEALLSANADVKCDLKQLRAGTMDWRFFKRSTGELARLFKPLSNLARIELMITVDGMYETTDEADAIARCRRVLSKGALRAIFRSMPQLESLCIELLSWEGEDLDRGASLHHIIEPGFHWPRLRELVIGGVDCDRQELMAVLELHKETLRNLCLRNVYLKSTSWKKLLPKKLYLTEPCICGNLYGHLEGEDEPDGPSWPQLDNPLFEPGLEYWYLSVPEDGRHEMRDSINVYCRLGGTTYPDELPLSNDVVDKYYKKHVKGFLEDYYGEFSDVDDENEWEDVSSEDDDSEDDNEDIDIVLFGDDDNDGDAPGMSMHQFQMVLGIIDGHPDHAHNTLY
ncbi:hypothetical protein DL769_011080 [Monosporascus sp. CRB-8-3]|nr:hypothetical protein DL769_011080 [Monosporascus sp. CRB-8-3]